MLTSLYNTVFKTQWWRGLLSRVTIAYAFGSLVLSTSIAYFTFTIAQERLIGAFEDTALIQLSENVRETRNGLLGLPDNPDTETGGTVLTAINEKLKHSGSSDSVLVLKNIGVRLTNRDEREIPIALTQELDETRLAGMYYTWDGEKRYIVGARLDNVNGEIDADYLEIHSLTALDNTLLELRRILIGAAIISSLAGATLGYYAAKRALAPISRVSSAAQEIAKGNFQTRLDVEVDPDLAILSSSFNEMVDQLRTKVERDQRFTSDVSHELRSPLMTLTASTELLDRKKDEMPETARQAVTLIKHDLKRFEDLVEDLLEISRMDAGAVQLQLTPFELPEFLVNVIAQSSNPDIELRHSNRDRDLIISADKRRIAQVLSNLISNADKYAGGAKNIAFRQVGKSVQITVEDQGPGIAVEERQRIFERFSRGVSDAGNRASGSGVGLGLSLVAEHIRLHGGKVWVTDRIDGKQGARFVVEIPIGERIEHNEEMAV